MTRFLLLLFFSASFFISNSFAQKSQSFNVLENGIVGTDSLPLKLSDGNISGFLFGETHLLKNLPKLKLACIVNLYQAFDVKDVVMEFSFSAAYLMNYFLQTGDSSVLLKNKIPYAFFPDERKFWYQLFVFNQQQAENKKIKIWGVDFERQEMISVLLLLQPKDKNVPTELLPLFAELKQYENNTHNCTDNQFVLLHQKLILNKAALLNFYGNENEIVKKIIENHFYYEALAIREKNMAANFLNQFDSMTNRRFVGFFGSDHLMETDANNLPFYLANKINRTALQTICMVPMPNKKNKSDKDLLHKYHLIARNKHDLAMLKIINKTNFEFTLINSNRFENKKIFSIGDFILLAN